jgi:alpha-2-macroglobulin
MKKSADFVRLILFIFAFSFIAGLAAGEDAQVVLFTPQGEVKGVRQVQARFSEQIVPFGAMVQLEPFDLSCLEKGHGRWADGKNWVYDFDRDLPAGVVCRFTLKKDLATLDGKSLVGPQTFSFSTGGPAVRTVRPSEEIGRAHV